MRVLQCSGSPQGIALDTLRRSLIATLLTPAGALPTSTAAQADKTAPLQAALVEWLAQFKVPNNLRLAVDIDPQSFY